MKEERKEKGRKSVGYAATCICAMAIKSEWLVRLVVGRMRPELKAADVDGASLQLHYEQRHIWSSVTEHRTVITRL